MEWQDIIMLVGGILAMVLGGGSGIGVLVAWFKNLKVIRALNLEKVIDQAADIAVHYVEAWGKQQKKKGIEKLNKATEVFQAELKRQGIKLDTEAMVTRLETTLSRIELFKGK